MIHVHCDACAIDDGPGIEIRTELYTVESARTAMLMKSEHLRLHPFHRGYIRFLVFISPMVIRPEN